jgi:hypothetical protein
MLKRGVNRRKKEKESKGLSTVIATLLIIMLTLIVIGILWVVLRNVIIHQSEIAGVQKEFFAENVEILSFKVDGGLINFSLKKVGGEIRAKNEINKGEIVEEMELDIISIIDLSGSMCSCNGVSSSCCTNTLRGDSYSGGNCYGVNSNRNTSCISTCGGTWVDRLSSAKAANRELINVLSESEDNRIGLIVYSTSVNNSASLDLTNNLTQLNNKIDSWQARGSTCICCGINEAARRLQQQSSDDKDKIIIVMSDGDANIECSTQHTHNAVQDAIKSSCDANQSLENLVVHSIGVGENVNEGALINISICGGGKYFSAINVSELIQAYKRVAEEIKSSHKAINRFNYLYIVFYNETSSYREKIFDIPDPLVIRKYQFDLTGKIEGNITKVEIYPAIVSESGKEIIGPLFDSWEYE